MSSLNSQRTISFLILSGSLSVAPSTDSTCQCWDSRAPQVPDGSEKSYLTSSEFHQLDKTSVIITPAIPFMCFFAIKIHFTPVILFSLSKNSWGNKGRDWSCSWSHSSQEAATELGPQITFEYILLLHQEREESLLLNSPYTAKKNQITLLFHLSTWRSSTEVRCWGLAWKLWLRILVSELGLD